MNKSSACLWFSFLLFTSSTFMISPFLSLYTLRIGGDEFIVGAVYAVFTLSTFVSRIPLARLSNVFGGVAMMILGHVTSAAGVIFYSLAQSPFHLFLGSAVRGLGFSLYHPSALSMTVGDDAIESRMVTGIILTAPPIGMMLGPMLGALTIEELGFEGLFYAAGLISLLGIAPTWFMYGGGEAARVAAHPPPVKKTKQSSLVLNRMVLSVMAVRLSLSYSAATIVAFLPVLLKREVSLGSFGIGALFSLAAFANVLARPLSGYLSSRMGEDKTIYLAITLMSLAVTLLPINITPLTWVGMILYGFSMGLFIPSSVLLISRTVPPELRTLSIAYVTSIMDLGSVLGSFVSGAVASSMGINAAFAAALLIIASTSLVSVMLRRKRSP